MEKLVDWIGKNWDKIPDSFKRDIRPNTYSNVPELKLEEHIVVLLLDRQKPSIEQSYDFNEERIGITKTGKIIWGFDSGCSCPSPWDSNFPGCYTVSKEWKQVELEAKNFDEGWLEEAQEKIEEIKKLTKNNEN